MKRMREIENMARVYVAFSKLENVGSYCGTAASKIGSIQSDFQTTVSRLDWDIKFESDINSTAAEISEKLEAYAAALKEYSQFIEDVCEEYARLDEYEDPSVTIETIAGKSESSESGTSLSDTSVLQEILYSFGLFGKITKYITNLSDNSEWYEWVSDGLSGWNLISKLSTDISNYAKVGTMIGTGTSVSYFLRNFFGLNATGYASQASSLSARFYNNLHNTTSSYTLSGAFSSFTGAKGVAAAVTSWAGVALTGVASAYSNLQEQNESGGTMSTGRVVAETVTETAISTLITYGGSALIGAGIAAVTGTVAAPVVVAIATGAVIAGANAGVSYLTNGETTSIVEFASDTILNVATDVGSTVSDMLESSGTAVASIGKTVSGWFGSLSFSW